MLAEPIPNVLEVNRTEEVHILCTFWKCPKVGNKKLSISFDCFCAGFPNEVVVGKGVVVHEVTKFLRRASN